MTAHSVEEQLFQCAEKPPVLQEAAAPLIDETGGKPFLLVHGRNDQCKRS